MTETEVTPIFKIESMKDFKDVLTIARGGDPDAIQAIASFMSLDSDTERSYFPDKITALCIGQLNGFGKLFFPNDDWDPFTLVSDSLSVAYMGYKGFKSNQFVDMTRQTPNLADLQTQSEPVKSGILSGLFKGRRTE